MYLCTNTSNDAWCAKDLRFWFAWWCLRRDALVCLERFGSRQGTAISDVRLPVDKNNDKGVNYEMLY